jgi:hypothetical protein
MLADMLLLLLHFLLSILEESDVLQDVSRGPTSQRLARKSLKLVTGPKEQVIKAAEVAGDVAPTREVHQTPLCPVKIPNSMNKWINAKAVALHPNMRLCLGSWRSEVLYVLSVSLQGH